MAAVTGILTEYNQLLLFSCYFRQQAQTPMIAHHRSHSSCIPSRSDHRQLQRATTGGTEFLIITIKLTSSFSSLPNLHSYIDISLDHFPLIFATSGHSNRLIN